MWQFVIGHRHVISKLNNLFWLFLDTELNKAGYRGSNTSINSTSSLNSTKSSVDNAPIYFTPHSHEEDAFVTIPNGYVTVNSMLWPCITLLKSCNGICFFCERLCAFLFLLLEVQAMLTMFVMPTRHPVPFHVVVNKCSIHLLVLWLFQSVCTECKKTEQIRQRAAGNS